MKVKISQQKVLVRMQLRRIDLDKVHGAGRFFREKVAGDEVYSLGGENQKESSKPASLRKPFMRRTSKTGGN